MPTRTYALVDNRLWERVTGRADPWEETRSADVDACGDTELTVEDLGDEIWFDLDTRSCAFVTVRQPLARDIPAGAWMSLRIWHFKISSWEGVFHLAYQIGADRSPEWELEKEVPAASSLITDAWAASRAYSRGEDVYFHLSNHGDNTWSLVELVATF